MPVRTLFRLVLALSVFQAAAVFAADASGPIGYVVSARGGVSARSAANVMRPLSGSNDPLYAREAIVTDASGHAEARLIDDTTISVGPMSVMELDEFVYDPSAGTGQVAVRAALGFFRFVTGKIGKNKPENVKIRFPMGNIGIFGTDLLGDIGPDRATILLRAGRISVENSSGRTVIDLAGYAATIDRGGAPSPAFLAVPAVIDTFNRALDLSGAPSQDKTGQQTASKPGASIKVAAVPSAVDDLRNEVRNEVALGLSKDAVQAAAAVEARRAEYQEGKVMIDINGKLVRLEEYIVRPAPDQFKFVVLNERADSFNYFYYSARFNQILPPVLAQALTYLNGKTGTAPNFYITSFETGRSNSVDSILEDGTGGHLVNAPLAANTVVYDPGSNTFNTVAAGTPFWSTLFNNYSYKINGTEKYGWQPAPGVANITAYDYTATGFNTRILGGGANCGAAGCATAGPVTCTALACETAARPSAVTNPDGTANLHDRATISYAANGTSEIYDFYVVDNLGNMATAAEFNGLTSGAAYKNTLLKFNFEQVIAASEFSGRKIDLVVEPKILVNSGVIQ